MPARHKKGLIFDTVLILKVHQGNKHLPSIERRTAKFLKCSRSAPQSMEELSLIWALLFFAVLSLFSICAWALNLGSQSGQPIRAGSRWCWQSMTLGMLMVGPGTITMKSGMVTGSFSCIICLCKVIKPVPRLKYGLKRLCPD